MDDIVHPPLRNTVLYNLADHLPAGLGYHAFGEQRDFFCFLVVLATANAALAGALLFCFNKALLALWSTTFCSTRWSNCFRVFWTLLNLISFDLTFDCTWALVQISFQCSLLYLCIHSSPLYFPFNIWHSASCMGIRGGAMFSFWVVFFLMYSWPMVWGNLVWSFCASDLCFLWGMRCNFEGVGWMGIEIFIDEVMQSSVEVHQFTLFPIWDTRI